MKLFVITNCQKYGLFINVSNCDKQQICEKFAEEITQKSQCCKIKFEGMKTCAFLLKSCNATGQIMKGMDNFSLHY